MKLEVTHGKAFLADGQPVPKGTIIDDVEEIPGFLVGKVRVIEEAPVAEEAPAPEEKPRAK